MGEEGGAKVEVGVGVVLAELLMERVHACELLVAMSERAVQQLPLDWSTCTSTTNDGHKSGFLDVQQEACSGHICCSGHAWQ